MASWQDGPSSAKGIMQYDIRHRGEILVEFGCGTVCLAGGRFCNCWECGVFGAWLWHRRGWTTEGTREEPPVLEDRAGASSVMRALLLATAKYGPMGKNACRWPFDGILAKGKVHEEDRGWHSGHNPQGTIVQHERRSEEEALKFRDEVMIPNMQKRELAKIKARCNDVSASYESRQAGWRDWADWNRIVAPLPLSQNLSYSASGQQQQETEREREAAQQDVIILRCGAAETRQADVRLAKAMGYRKGDRGELDGRHWKDEWEWHKRKFLRVGIPWGDVVELAHQAFGCEKRVSLPPAGTVERQTPPSGFNEWELTVEIGYLVGTQELTWVPKSKKRPRFS